jgi:AraC-like DNA-binding protein
MLHGSPMPTSAAVQADTLFVLHNALSTFIRIPCSYSTLDPAVPWRVLFESAEHTIHEYQNAYGNHPRRVSYNARNLRRAVRTKRPVLASLLGFWDVYVPLVDGGRARGCLVAGVFLRKPPSAADITRHWRALTGKNPRPTDPTFRTFARALIRTTVLDDAKLDAYKELLSIGGLAIRGGATAASGGRIQALIDAHFAKMPWAFMGKAADYLDPVKSWYYAAGNLPPWDETELGISRAPNAVVAVHVACAGTELESVLRLDAFQRACASFCRRLPETTCAALEDVGVFLMHHVPATGPRARTILLTLAQKVVDWAWHDQKLRAHVGIGGVGALRLALPGIAARAKVAMELAVHRDVPIVVYDDEPSATGDVAPGLQIPRLARQLLEQFDQGAANELALTRAEYIGQVVSATSGQPAAMRAHFEHLADGLLARVRRRAGLASSDVKGLEKEIHRALDGGRTTSDLLTSLRAWIDHLLRLAEAPDREDRDRRIDRAAEWIEDHCEEPLTLKQTARHAGFSTAHFSRLFTAKVGTGFGEYLVSARLERAKPLLRGTALPIFRVAYAAGFASVAHFCHAFKKKNDLTPMQFRGARGAGDPKR